MTEEQEMAEIPAERITDKRRKPGKIYVKNSELYDELLKWRDSGPKGSRIPSEKLGEMLLKIATRYMTHPNYIRYSQEIKEDIIGSSCIAMLSALDSYNFEYKNPFAYFTQVCWSTAMTYLAQHYKRINFTRDLMKQNIEEQVASGINVQSGERYLKMLNDLCERNGAQKELIEDNQKFISDLIGREVESETYTDDTVKEI